MYIFILFLIIPFALLFWAIMKYNILVTMKNQVTNGWSQIDIQLKRRHDLIPNLVNTVKGYMEFEQDTLRQVIAARNAAANAKGVAEAAVKEGELSQVLSRLFSLVESYPNIKADEHVRTLMEELTSTENTIAFSRQFYNDITTKFNTSQQTFPGNIIANMFIFRPAELFELKVEKEREAPVVTLSVRS